MKQKMIADYQRVRAERQKTGLSFGLLAGLGFSLATWGYDAYLLVSASADLGWLKLAIGGFVCMVVGGFVGWLTASIDSAVISFFAWLVTGIGFAWFASHLPFEVLTRLNTILNPLFKGLVLYPYTTNVKLRMVVVYAMMILVSGIGGSLQSYIVETARVAGTRFMRWMILASTLIIFGLGGNATDNINQPFREPIVGVDRVIRFALSMEGATVDKKLANEMRLRVIEPLKNFYHKPRRLILGDYESFYLDNFTVYIDFDGTWAYCSVFLNQPGFCQLSQETYPKQLACLLDGKDADKCKIQMSEVAMQQFATWKAQVQPPLSLALIAQRGPYTLMSVTNADRSESVCRFSGVHYSASLEECAPFQKAGTFPVTQPIATWIYQPQEQVNPQDILPDMIWATYFAPQELALLESQQDEITAYHDLLRYTIRVNIDFDQHRLDGHLRLDYTNTANDPLDKLYFRLFPNGEKSFGKGSMEVSNITKEGVPVISTLSLDDTVLEVSLVRPLPVGAQTFIEMDFVANVPVDLGNYGYGIYAFSENVLSLANWFPILAVYDDEGWNLDPVSAIGDSVYSDAAFYTVDVQLSPNLILVATGVEIASRERDEALQVRYASGPVRDFFMIISPAFVKASENIAGVQVNSYYLPGDQQGGEKALQIAIDSLQAYNHEFGLYPYNELDVVETPLRYASGVEYPGVILIASGLYPNPEDPKLTYVTAHEVGHQWWYNVVGNDVIDDPWLDEALTTFTSTLYFDVTQGTQAYQEAVGYFQGRYDSFLSKYTDDQITASLSHFENLADPTTYGAIVYSKGALFFAALRKKIGDQAFFLALQDYYASYKYQIATPEDLLGVFQKASGSDLSAFYQEWLY